MDISMSGEQQAIDDGKKRKRWLKIPHTPRWSEWYQPYGGDGMWVRNCKLCGRDQEWDYSITPPPRNAYGRPKHP